MKSNRDHLIEIIARVLVANVLKEAEVTPFNPVAPRVYKKKPITTKPN